MPRTSPRSSTSSSSSGPTPASVAILSRRGGAAKLERIRRLVWKLDDAELDMLEQLATTRRLELAKLSMARHAAVELLEQNGRVLVRERRRTGGGCFRLELVRCGKEHCRCATQAKLHGPYWYVYTPGGGRGGKPSHRYIGKPGSEAASIAALD